MSGREGILMMSGRVRELAFFRIINHYLYYRYRFLYKYTQCYCNENLLLMKLSNRIINNNTHMNIINILLLLLVLLLAEGSTLNFNLTKEKANETNETLRTETPAVMCQV